MEIAGTGNVKLLVVTGSPDSFVCLQRWEEIVKENAEQNNNQDYDSYFQGLKLYSTLQAEYVLAKALLTYLCFSIDYEHITHLRKLGYKIDTTNTESFTVSLSNGLRKADNLKTKIETKMKELQLLFKGDGNGKPETFEQVLAHLNAGLGFNVNEDITLSRFNEYKKILKQRQPKGDGRD
jgi:hypothetical protein